MKHEQGAERKVLIAGSPLSKKRVAFAAGGREEEPSARRGSASGSSSAGQHVGPSREGMRKAILSGADKLLEDAKRMAERRLAKAVARRKHQEEQEQEQAAEAARRADAFERDRPGGEDEDDADQAVTRAFDAQPPGRSSLLSRASTARAKRVKMEAAAEEAGEGSMVRVKSEKMGMVKKEPGASAFTRDERLRLMESIPMGPADFVAKEDDPEWEKMEPYSKIALKRRDFPHADMELVYNHRLRLQTSLLYSVARLRQDQMDRQRSQVEYELPFPRSQEWVIITVLVDKSPIRLSRKKPIDGLADASLFDEGHGELDMPETLKGQEANSYARRGQRKLFMATLLDLHRDGVQGGDDYLQMTLFESDMREERRDALTSGVSGSAVKSEFDKYEEMMLGSDVKPGLQPSEYDSFKGGSYGAFEKLYKEPEGTVVAIINPRIMPKREFNGTSDKNMITLTPASAKSIIVLGKAADFAACEALKKNGEKCGAFVDARWKKTSSRPGATWMPICAWHQAFAIDKSIAHRPELGAVDRFVRGQKKTGKNATSGGGKGVKSETSWKAGGGNGKYGRGSRDIPYAWTAEDGPSGVGAGGVYTTIGRENGDREDESNILFDITAKYGRNVEEKEKLVKKRKREETVIAKLDLAAEATAAKKASAARSRDPTESRRSIEKSAKLKALHIQGHTQPQEMHLWRGVSQTNSAISVMQQAEKALQEKRRKEQQKSLSGRRARGRGVGVMARGAARDDRSMALDSDEDGSGDGDEDQENLNPGGTVPVPKYRYSAQVVKQIGFNPLADAYGKMPQTGSAGEVDLDDEDNPLGRLLARNSASTAALPEPKLKAKVQYKWRNVRPPQDAEVTSQQKAYAETYGLNLDNLSDYSLSDGE